MRQETIQSILDINRQFYQTFGDAFAATRRRIQPGIRRILADLPGDGHWLDLGCGSGALALEWIRLEHTGSYTGIDFSTPLLAEAQRSLSEVSKAKTFQIQFQQADLLSENWPVVLSRPFYDGVLCFAAMHHLPGRDSRRDFLKQVRHLLQPGSSFFHSNWQFQHSPKLVGRIQPWTLVDLDESDLDNGDTLLDWRYSLPGQAETSGLRYVHIFSQEELAELASETGFKIIDTFESDGEGGRLGLYQHWVAD
jgi:SAM-dependent methyltransferase